MQSYNSRYNYISILADMGIHVYTCVYTYNCIYRYIGIALGLTMHVNTYM